ncbi:MAG: L-2-amino-thiazoline-4-carboxylic acid hydrolase [Deltaproteobacteria bacterium]|nr:L-2-amino-thiazoline-4-carboxylic acid hydrolase [Deltaproteobacteria bacterium]
MASLSVSFQIRSALLGLSILRRRLGWGRMLGTAANLTWRQMRGEPWRGLPKPEDDKERLSRQQSGPAVLLYRALCRQVGREQALEITREVVIDATQIFLREQIPVLDPDELLRWEEPKRLAFLRGLTDRFFNADTANHRVGDNRVSFFVTRCRFPELMLAVGHPELAPLYCEGDGIFFEREQPRVRFLRTRTLAADQESCDFSFEPVSPVAGSSTSGFSPGDKGSSTA